MKSVYQSVFIKNIHKARHGQIVLQLPDGTVQTCGSKDGNSPAALRVLDKRFFREVVHGGGIGLGESYQRGHWTSNDVTKVLRWLLVNSPQIAPKMSPFLAGIVKRANNLINAVHHLRNRNTIEGSRENIHAHYDLGNEFYKTFLDNSMTYSSGYFTSKEDTLEDAQFEKYDRLCRKLNLAPMNHVLEIGCGWGGFAIHAATHYGCCVTATTISQEQYIEARRRVRAAGLENRIHITMTDYRELEGKFDRIASVEMLEAVGKEYLGEYFERVEDLLETGGLAGIQVITCPNPLYEAYSKRVDWIQKHIFPGSHLPSTHALLERANINGNLETYHFESFGLHYARTLKQWRERFTEHWPEIEQQGFDEAFKRKWEYYFSYCEAGFEERHVNVCQLVFGRADETSYQYETSDQSAQQRESKFELASLNAS